MATKNEAERIAVVETKVDNVLERLDHIDQKLDGLENKFAAKWVQSIVAGLVAAILLGFMGVVIAFFIPNKPTSNNPTSSTTTTTNNPQGSTSTTKTSDTPQNVTANANAQADSVKDSESSDGLDGLDGVVDQVPKVFP